LGAARRHLDDTIYQLIRARRQKGDVNGEDLLSTMLRLQQEPSNQAFLTDQSIRDELLTMLTAGHETISSALAWTWYLLARHPEAEQRVHDELAAALAGRRPTIEDLPKLSYARMVFAESMRLYPPVWASARRLVRDLDIGGYRIPDGACVYFTQYLVHRDARFHPDPNRFNPERFLPDEQAKRPKYAYFPFGGGNRQCIGEGFAWTEALLLIAALAQHWRFRLVAGHPIEVDPLIALQPKFGIRMILEKRRPSTPRRTEPSETHGAAV
jgi:cytochrome P450